MAIKRKKKTGAYTTLNTVKIIRGGADYFRCIDEIAARATYSLHLQTYIFDENETGNRVADALMAAAKRGVLVYVLLDGYASQNLSGEFIKRLIDSGVHFRFFEPMLRSRYFYFGRRLHHKIIVADARECMVSGANISDRYNDMPDAPAWLDWALHAEGDVAKEADKICVRMWNRSVFQKKCAATKNPAFKPPPHQCRVWVTRNDWVYKKTEITASYHELLREAKSEITIMTGYFCPPMTLLRRMEVAARGGVKIRLVLTANADVPFAKYMERYLYARLFRSDIEVYEYSKNILHGKLAIRDKEWVTVGSYNLNNLSAYASVEMNFDVQDNAIATQLHTIVQDIIDNDCEQITKANFDVYRNPVKKFFYFLSYFSVYTVFKLATFYFSQHSARNRG